jgi:hypothetical protein
MLRKVMDYLIMANNLLSQFLYISIIDNILTKRNRNFSIESKND